MKRLMVLMVAGAVVAGGAAEAVGAKDPASFAGGKSRARVVTEAYTPAEIGTWIITPTDPGVSVASAEILAQPHEKTVSIVVKDDAGSPVRGGIYQRDNSARQRWVATFCGKTDGPVTIDPSKPVVVQVFSGLCGDSVGVATKGTVTATFR